MIHNLPILDPDRRIAAVLLRVGGHGDALPLSQEEVGAIACVTRKVANLALRRFVERGWIAQGYRSVRVADAAALRDFVTAAEG